MSLLVLAISGLALQGLPMFPKTKVVRREAVTVDESHMKSLLNAPSGLVGLLDYLTACVQNANEEFRDAAAKAAFDPDHRVDAVHKHGIMEGFEQVRQRIEELRSTGK